MRASHIAVRIGAVAGICLAAPIVRAQESKLEPGMSVVAKSPDFTLRDGAKVIHLSSLFDKCRVERVEGDRVRLYAAGREGDALASEVVRVDQAEAYFSEQIKANPRAVYGYLMRSFVRGVLQHDSAGSLRDCEQAIRLEPKNPWAYLLRGSIRGEQVDLKEALGDFDQAIALNEKIVDAYLCRAGCHLALGDADKAMADIERAIRRDPENPGVYALRGAVWAERGDHEKALRDYGDAIRLAPGSASVRLARAEYFGSAQVRSGFGRRKRGASPGAWRSRRLYHAGEDRRGHGRPRQGSG